VNWSIDRIWAPLVLQGLQGQWPLLWLEHLSEILHRLQLIGTLSGGQKSRVAFAALSLQRPHILLLDEVSHIYHILLLFLMHIKPSNHLDSM
jgi:ABC-type arginine transport system ATPase subunit